MDYRIELYDAAGRRIATWHEVPLLEATRTAPDEADVIEGILPSPVAALGHGYRVRVYIDGALFLDAPVTEVRPQWSDTKKLILERFVFFHEVIGFRAEIPDNFHDGHIARGYISRPVGEIVRNAINTTLGPIHYAVDHTAYPDGAQHEFTKFEARRTPANELEIGGIDAGDWVDSSRIDLTNAIAKDGDTISGLVVDGEAWPDLRLMLIDAEELTRNSHAISRHPEVADWTDAQYTASGYKLKADAAMAFLQALIDTHGIDYIELNPHRDANGNFDDRVDAFGRYLGLVFGGGECYNAALVEQNLTDVFLFEDGAFHVPELALKDFFSYTGPHADSVADAPAVLERLELDAELFESLTALAYAADGYAWHVDVNGTVSFRPVDVPDRVLYYDPVQHAFAPASESRDIVNAVFFDGNPTEGAFEKSYFNGASIDAFGFNGRGLDYYAISREADADRLTNGLLQDIAYPAPAGEIVFLHGDATIDAGELIELRGAPVRRLDEPVAGEWGDRFTGRFVARVRAVTHRFRGKRVETVATLTSPLRSVTNPLTYLGRSQPPATSLFQFRLDDDAVGLDMGVHID